MPMQSDLAQGIVLGVVGVASLLCVLRLSRKALSPVEADASSSGLVRTQIGSPHPYVDAEKDYQGCIYLDSNATTVVYAEVFQAMRPYLTNCFGNPASSHVYGRKCAQALATARRQVGSLLNAHNPDKEIVFMSCGTEVDNRAVDVALHHYHEHWRNSGSYSSDSEIPLPVVIASAVEHPAVLSYLRMLQSQKKLILVQIPVSSEGVVDSALLEASLCREVALVTVMHSNNEVGTIQPIRLISQAVSKYNAEHGSCILMHTDAAQSVGKVPVDVQVLQCDLLTIVGHKFGAPKGVSALYARESVKIPKLLIGGGQERGLRAGTECVPLIVALGAACEMVEKELCELLLHYMTLKQALVASLREQFGQQSTELRFNGPQRCCDAGALSQDTKMLRAVLRPFLSPQVTTSAKQQALPDQLVSSLPNTVSVSFKGKIGNEVLGRLGTKVACSAGSACHSGPHGGCGKAVPVYVMSDVLKAMNVPQEYGLGTLRLSFGRHTSLAEVQTAARLIYEVVSEKQQN